MQRHEPRFSMAVRGILKRFSNRLITPRVVLSLLILAILTVFVVMPFTRLVRDTLVWQKTDIRHFAGCTAGNVHHLPLGTNV
jgi:hypothetical protein